MESILGCFDEPPEIKWDTSKPSGEAIRLVDMTRAKEMLGFSPRTSIRDGIAATVEWYKENSASAKDRYNIFHQKDYMAT